MITSGRRVSKLRNEPHKWITHIKKTLTYVSTFFLPTTGSPKEHLRGSRQHKVYQQLKYDTDRDRAEAIAQWTADETPVKIANGQLADSEVDHLNPSGSDLGQQDSQEPSSSGGGHSLGKQVIVSAENIFFIWLSLFFNSQKLEQCQSRAVFCCTDRAVIFPVFVSPFCLFLLFSDTFY